VPKCSTRCVRKKARRRKGSKGGKGDVEDMRCRAEGNLAHTTMQRRRHSLGAGDGNGDEKVAAETKGLKMEVVRGGKGRCVASEHRKGLR